VLSNIIVGTASDVVADGSAFLPLGS
jgi:hypothetical protein